MVTIVMYKMQLSKKMSDYRLARPLGTELFAISGLRDIFSAYHNPRSDRSANALLAQLAEQLIPTAFHRMNSYLRRHKKAEAGAAHSGERIWGALAPYLRTFLRKCLASLLKVDHYRQFGDTIRTMSSCDKTPVVLSNDALSPGWGLTAKANEIGHAHH